MSINFTNPALPIVQTELGSYFLDKTNKLGSGTTGSVYSGIKFLAAPVQLTAAPYQVALFKTKKAKVENPLLDDPVAIKIFNRKDRCMKEEGYIKMATECKIPHAVRFRDSIMRPSSRQYQIVMDLVPGETLDEIIHKLHWTDVITISKQLLEFLDGLHAQNIIHADLKPSNTIYEPDARYLTVLDFGNFEKSSASQTLNFNGPFQIIQTLNFRAPEIMLEMGHTTRVDIWSLGCIIYQLVTNQHFINRKLDYWDGIASNNDLRNECLQDICRLIGLPSKDFVVQVKNQSICPWTVEKGTVKWKTPVHLTPIFWEETFRQRALARNAPKEEIELFVSILRKIFCFEGRASIKELVAEFDAAITKDIKVRLEGMGRLHKVTITSNGVSTTIDNSQHVHRTCIHIPKSSDGTYFVTIADDEKTILTDVPIQQSKSNFVLSIPALLYPEFSPMPPLPPDCKLTRPSQIIGELFPQLRDQKNYFF